jgi:hypothetical protein
MRKLSEYQQHAKECRRMAAQTKNSTHKRQLEEMAQTWEMLARERTLVGVS